ncbi:cation/H(+) antiporter [Amycolatopsis sp. A1MSW2902]|uniref:cation:proton antiporter n=1 Tax=Amycolatopsis sp. A1MSW2902 TaxID=687413 RepID=UPI00307D7A03
MTDQVALLLVDLALILLIAHLFGAAAGKLGQPAVIGEIVAGIALGPTLFAGQLSTTLIPPDVRPLLAPMADVGVALFMFVIGLELDRSLINERRRVIVAIAASATLVPFALGSTLAWYLLPAYPTEHRLGFVLFLGVAMGATAFPVLARILADRKLRGTPLGTMSLGIAAIGDVVVWTVLTGVVALVGDGNPARLLFAVPYLAVMLLAVRPLLSRLLTTTATPRLLVVTVGVLASGGATEWLGLHFAFGAFLFGFVFPKNADQVGTARQVSTITSVLLPVYFVTAGLRVDLSDLVGTRLLDPVLVLLVAVVGKAGAAYVAARLQRVPAPDATTLAVLLNTRGLTELVILTIGLQSGLVGQDLYSLMVVMALVTTAMTGPLLTVPDRRTRGHIAMRTRWHDGPATPDPVPEVVPRQRDAMDSSPHNNFWPGFDVDGSVLGGPDFCLARHARPKRHVDRTARPCRRALVARLQGSCSAAEAAVRVALSL